MRREDYFDLIEKNGLSPEFGQSLLGGWPVLIVKIGRLADCERFCLKRIMDYLVMPPFADIPTDPELGFLSFDSSKMVTIALPTFLSFG